MWKSMLAVLRKPAVDDARKLEKKPFVTMWKDSVVMFEDRQGVMTKRKEAGAMSRQEMLCGVRAAFAFASFLAGGFVQH